MAFGKSGGPPASHQQLNDLLELLQAEGHEDFRDARGPMGFTQRQAGGKFTRDEAQQFIDQLEEEVDRRNEEARAEAKATPAEPTAAEPAEAEEAAPSALGEVPSEDLVAELRRRGWSVSKP